ncbi:unnamed protein product [Ilex paraguariensis]|uniref:chitinase n=1 Tax=Ilex paraguariensis TaxID=185542 RepID=A0ABC8SQB1_9AQUA
MSTVFYKMYCHVIRNDLIDVIRAFFAGATYHRFRPHTSHPAGFKCEYGLDGMSTVFYKMYCHVIRNDLIDVIRAFFAGATYHRFRPHTSHPAGFKCEATGPDVPFAWGYCFKEEQGNPPDYCVANQQWPCVPGKKYYGRGPIQISYNYNYGPAGRPIGLNLLNSPETVANYPVVSFKTALWFWMTPQSPKPSCHDVITGTWRPSAADTAAGRVPGYGVITNIINGGIECGKGSNPQVEDRIGFYKRYCDILGVGYGNNLDCYNQRPFA